MKNYTGQIVSKIPKGEEDNFIPIPTNQIAKVKRMSMPERLRWLEKHEDAIRKANKKKNSRKRTSVG